MLAQQGEIVTSGGLGGHALQVVIGAAASVIAAVVLIYLGIGRENEISIEGPSTVPALTTPTFNLTGYASGEPETVYWTDTYGAQVALSSGGVDAFFCPSLGEFKVTLTAIYSDGSREQASHAITCQ